jgi:sterol 3beta-glucosyltransferase
VINLTSTADVRAIVAKGWSTRDAKEGEDPVQWPDNCYPLDKVPHGWLFPKIDAAMHHGGAGTTGASLRAGIPTIIKPWFGDQHFWALRVTKLEVGVKVAALRADEVAEALRKATTSTVMIEKARRIGERITQESGVDAAVQAIHFNLVRAAKNRAALKKQDHKAVSTPAFPTLPKLAACKNA